jgi:hypothetical protein
MNYYTGISNKLNLFNISRSDIFASIGFYSGNKSDNRIYPDDWSFPFSATGNLVSNNPNSFYFSGSGFFNRNSYINFTKPFQINNSLTFLSFERTSTRDEVLFSTLQYTSNESLTNSSGYYLGINDANKLYFRYLNPVEGPFTFTFSKMLSNKNLIYIYKQEDSITIGKYNNNLFEFETETFDIFNNSFKDSNILTLGGAPNTTLDSQWVVSNNFSGYIDKFYSFNNVTPLYANNLGISLFSNPGWVETITDISCFITGSGVFSGFSYTGVTGILNSGFAISNTGITGYVNILSGFSYSGVTGYNQIIVGSFVDNCGNIENIYNTIPLTGNITGSISILNPLTGLIFSTGSISINLTGTITGQSLIYTTGEICVTGTNIEVIQDYYIHTGFLTSLSFKEISLLKENLVTGDILEVFTENYQPKIVYNNATFEKNSVNKYYRNDRSYGSGDLILYKNGQALTNIGGFTETSGYDVIYNPNLDYFITGDRIYTKDFNDNDYIFYDNITGNYWGRLLTGSTLVLPPGYTINNNLFIFKNGQKLIRSRDYIPVTTNIFGLINTAVNQDNYIMIKEYFNNFNLVTGESTSIRITGSFNNGCSIVYYNGIKQKINNNYVENSNFDLISGNFYIPINQNLLLNDNNDFFINI